MSNPTRRRFLQSSLAVGAAPFVLSRAALARPSDQLRLAAIGVWGRGWDDLNAVKSENIVAICDVDDDAIKRVLQDFPAARPYVDFRKLLEKESDLDGVIVATPDHTHAAASLDALRRGIPVYCEKPLAHTVDEVRRMRDAARAQNLPTQMGTQIHAGDNYRRVVELIRAGAIGEVNEVHVWCNKSWSDGRYTRPGTPPARLNWDMWQGPIPTRAFDGGLHPSNWRRFWNYGTGTLGDMGCHYLDLVHWALELGPATRVHALGPDPHPDGTPDSLIVKWTHDAPRGPVDVTWYDGKNRPSILSALREKDGARVGWGDGHLFVGSEGFLLSDYGRYRLFPEEKFEGFIAPEPSIPSSIGHHREWIEAIRSGAGLRGTTCNFEYAAGLSEAVLLGNVAFRSGGPITWDAAKLTTGSEAADACVRVEYRDGWAV